jgi:S1-C subfamily serine protease
MLIISSALCVAAPSIVSISNFKSVNGEDIAEGTGSGIVWDTYGHIVTNYHCIARLARDTTGAQVRALPRAGNHLVVSW